MPGEKRTPESVFELVDAVEAEGKVAEEASDEANKAIADILATARKAGAYGERLRVVRCWALFHAAFVNDLHRLAGAESELAAIFEEKSRNLGRMIDYTLVREAEAAGIFAPRGGSGVQESPFAFMDDEEDIAAEVEQWAEESQPDDELLSNVVKLMAKAGTRGDGLRAGWTAEEILYGLGVIMPGVQSDAIQDVLVRLGADGIIEDFNHGKAGVRIYCLRPDYTDRLGWARQEPPKNQEPGVEKQEEFRQSLRETLQSNKGANGKLVPWKLSALFYALQDRHPWITRPIVAATASAEPGCSEVAPQVYKWTEVKPEPSAGSGAVDAAFKGLRPAAEILQNHSITSGMPGVKRQSPAPPEAYPEAHIDEATPAGIVKAADAIYGVLKAEAASGQRRIWKEYDIIGLLGRGAELGIQLKDEYLSQEVLTAAMDFLVVEGQLEVVPLSPERPWIKQPGWRVAR